MIRLCLVLLVLRVLDDFFLVAPSGLGQYPLLHQTASWLNFVLPIGMGGMWMTVYMWMLSGRKLMVERTVQPGLEPQVV